MAFGRSKALAVSDAPASAPPRSLVASALRVRFDDASFNSWRFRDETWQRELWRLYDFIPEFRFAASWVGQCCSRVRIYVAKVDELGRVQGEAKDPKISALSDTLLGGPAAKAEHLRMMGIDLTVSGECYIVGRPDDMTGRDEWYILTGTEIRRIKGRDGDWEWAWGDRAAPIRLDLEKNIVTRVWTPHPARVWCADSPARSCQPILRELEQLTKYVFSQIDSRLIGAGLLIIPNNLDLPAEENTTSNGDSLMIRLATAGAQSLRGEGSALGILPHIIESPPESVDGFKLLSFESELSKQAVELRKEAIERLGVGMDMPPEVLSGMGDSNHWSGFLIDGYGIKVHIEPLMNRICDALTKAYLAPALKIMDKDPARYVYAFDTSPLALRPQRLQDALNLYEKDAISLQALREVGYFKESDAPSEDESAKRYLREIMLRDPQLIQNQAVREAVGISDELVPQKAMIAPTPGGMTMGGGGGPPPPPPPPTGIQSELPPPIPDTMGQVGAPPPGGGEAPPTGIQASASDQAARELGIVVVADAAVRRTLELAGKRMLDKDNRHRWPDVPFHELHTRIKVPDLARANRLLAGAWSQLDDMAKFVVTDYDPTALQKTLTKYCTILLLHGVAHDPPNLLAMLRADGIVHGQ